MTEDTDGHNGKVVSLDEHRPNPWRITAVRYKEGKAITRDGEGNQKVQNAFILNIQFLDREPSKLITADGDKGHKDVNIPIPVGIRADQLYEMLRSAPEQIQAHLDGKAQPTPPEAG